MACFADITVSQGSVEAYARCDGIIDIHLGVTENLPNLILDVLLSYTIKIFLRFCNDTALLTVAYLQKPKLRVFFIAEA